MKEKKKPTRKISFQALTAWAEEIGVEVPPVRVDVMNGEIGKKVLKLGDYDFLPSLKQLKADYGPGRYKLRVLLPNSKGALVYAMGRTLEIE